VAEFAGLALTTDGDVVSVALPVLKVELSGLESKLPEKSLSSEVVTTK